MQETLVRSLSQEDPLEKEMATHSNILAWKIPWTEEPHGLYSPWGCKESDTTQQLNNDNNSPSTSNNTQVTWYFVPHLSGHVILSYEML